MKNILPNVINIYGKRFKVKELDSTTALGIMDPDKSIIFINFKEHRTEKELLHTFFHEYFHAMHFRLGLFQVLSSEVLEILAETQATMIVETFF